MRINTRRIVTHTISDDAFPDVEFEVSYEPYESFKNSTLIAKLDEERVLIGYLCQDAHAENPLSEDYGDGTGRIFSSHRHSSTSYEMQQALALDSEWNPDIERIYDDPGHRQLVDDEYVAFFVANTSVSQLISDGFERNEGESDLEFQVRCAESDLEASYKTYSEEFDAIEFKWWKTLRSQNKIGAPFTISLDVYDHGGQVYSISGSGMQCAFDTARGGAVWVPDSYTLEHIQSFPEDEQAKQARKACQADLKTYNAWLCGDTYGICIAICDINTGKEISSDECWGYYEFDATVKEMEEQFQSTLVRKTKLETQT